MKKNKKKVLAVILARGGSKGIHKKNIVEINNHPLISYSIEAAKNSKFINTIAVSSDSQEILNISESYGIDLSIKRTKKLSDDKATSADALYDAVKKSEKSFGYKFDYIIELPCVSPLRDHNDIDRALQILLSNKQKFDSVVSYVDTGEKHPIRLKRIIKNKITNFCKEYTEADWGSRRQDFEPSYIRNGAIYSMTRECIISKKSRWGKKSFPMMMEDAKSVNIDTKFDLLIARLLIEKGFCKNKPKKKIVPESITCKSGGPNLLISTPLHFLGEIKEELVKKFNCHFERDIKEKNLLNMISDIDYWICNPAPSYLIDKKVLSKAKNLKAIFSPSTGITHIDEKYCKKKNIKIFSINKNKSIFKIKASSEFTFGLILDTLRNLSLGRMFSLNGQWRNQEDYLRGNQLFKTKLGIVGFGRIGSNVYKYAKSFGMQVMAYDSAKKSILRKKNIYQTSKNIFKKSDVVLISVNYNNKNKNLVNIDKLKTMKKSASLINTSRGEVLNENDLIFALKNKIIKSAAVDVISNEQNTDFVKNKLLEYSRFNSNLIITPHMAGLTYQSEKIAINIVLKKLFKFAGV